MARLKGQVLSLNGSISELNFLTDIPILNNNSNRDTIWNHLYNEISITGQNQVSNAGVTEFQYTLTDEQKNPKNVVVFKGNKDGKVNEYLKDKVYSDNEFRSYSGLLRKFESKGYESLRLESADLAYLSDLGVLPMNRMWILRRFKESDTVPDNLLDWKGPFPISTIVGWISPEETNFFGVDFNEEWITQTDRVDQVLSKMLDQEFGFKTSVVASVPGWSQGLLMGFLRNMGLTNFSADEIPFGNPNVLQEAATRVTDPTNTTYGLKSSMSVTLKTSYEQKFIGDIDPGTAMLDLIRNLTRMGTSDVRYFASKNAPILNDLRTAASAGNSIDAWWKFIEAMITGFIEAISDTFKEIKDTITGDEKPKGGAKIEQKLTGELTNLLSGALKAVLSSTTAKWKWPLKGGLGVITGENTTPWHLTIGNPNSPFVSLGNIKVSKVNIDFNNELGFNDIPTKMDIKIDVSFGRNLGAQEIFAMFNNGYTRIYDTENSVAKSLANFYKIKSSGNDESGSQTSKK